MLVFTKFGFVFVKKFQNNALLASINLLNVKIHPVFLFRKLVPAFQ
jgi:hypothetical protein